MNDAGVRTLVGLVVVAAVIWLIFFAINKSMRAKAEAKNPGLTRKIWMIVGVICAFLGGGWLKESSVADPDHVQQWQIWGIIFLIGGIAAFIRGYLKKST